MNYIHLPDDSRPFETYQAEPYSVYKLNTRHNKGDAAMVIASFGIYFALLGLVAYEDFFLKKSQYSLKA